MDSFRAGCPHCHHCSVGVRWQTLGKPWRQSTNGGGGRCPRRCLRHLASHRLLSAFRPKRPGESSATMGSLTVSGAGLVEPEASESRCRAACLVGVSQFESLRSGRSLRVEIRSSGDSDSRRPTERPVLSDSFCPVSLADPAGLRTHPSGGSDSGLGHGSAAPSPWGCGDGEGDGRAPARHAGSAHRGTLGCTRQRARGRLTLRRGPGCRCPLARVRAAQQRDC